MDEQWCCPFCERLYPWPEEVLDFLEGGFLQELRADSASAERLLFRRMFPIICSCGAIAGFREVIHPERRYPLDEAILRFHEEAGRSAPLAYPPRLVVYRRMKANGEVIGAVVQWVRLEPKQDLA